MKSSRIRNALAAGAAVLSMTATVLAPAPAYAQFGGIVYDPSNYSQNILTAARTLEQINNQIRQTQQLINQAQHIAYNVQDIERTFADKYKSIPMSASDQTLVANARERWATSVGAFEDALKVQAGVVGNIEGSRATMERLVTASQSATGALQAAQAGNQLLALQSQQLADLTAMLSAQARSQSLEAARQATAEADGRERFRRFIGGK